MKWKSTASKLLQLWPTIGTEKDGRDAKAGRVVRKFAKGLLNVIDRLSRGSGLYSAIGSHRAHCKTVN
jgi:hypothetical protein